MSHMFGSISDLACEYVTSAKSLTATYPWHPGLVVISGSTTVPGYCLDSDLPAFETTTMYPYQALSLNKSARKAG